MMPEVAEITDTYFADFARPDRKPAWLESIRKSAMERFADVGFPTTRQEDWRFTNVSALARTPFKVPAAGVKGLTPGSLKHAWFDGVAARIVFVNGAFEPKLSNLSALPAGVSVRPFPEAWDSKELEQSLARHAETDRNAFVALNTALFRDGALVEIAEGIALDKPVHVLFVRAGSAEETVTHPRTLISAGLEAQATVIESHLGLGADGYFTNAVTELVIGENASLEHLKLQEEGGGAYHVGTVQA
ncbi:MAG: SufD family Fe-S cluster assembly protein, partial [Terriglobia bacterium]